MSRAVLHAVEADAVHGVVRGALRLAQRIAERRRRTSTRPPLTYDVTVARPVPAWKTLNVRVRR